MNKFRINIGFNDFDAPELIFLIFSERYTEAKALLDNGVDVNLTDDMNHNALWWATEKNNHELISKILKSKSFTKVSSSEFQIYVARALEQKDFELYAFWRVHFPSLFIETRDFILKDSAGSHRLENAKDLLAEGADPNRLDLVDGKNSLHVAHENLDPEMVELLLSNGANPAIETRAGQALRDLIPFDLNAKEKSCLTKINLILERQGKK